MRRAEIQLGMDIHERIAHARRMAGLTQDEVADHFKIRRASVAQWEGKRSKPSVSRIVELARLLNTTPEWILNGVGDPPLPSDKPVKPAEDPITPELAEEYLDRLRRADPVIRDSVLALLGIRPQREE